MLDLHYVASINGHKIAVMLEETDTPYRLIPYNPLDGEHLTAEFHALNPNYKLPVIVDHDPAIRENLSRSSKPERSSCIWLRRPDVSCQRHSVRGKSPGSG